MKARRDGARFTVNRGRVTRPCEPDDLVKCLDGLYRRGRVNLLHARVLRRCGERYVSPNPGSDFERSEYRLWQEAMNCLEWPLRSKDRPGVANLSSNIRNINLDISLPNSLV